VLIFAATIGKMLVGGKFLHRHSIIKSLIIKSLMIDRMVNVWLSIWRLRSRSTFEVEQYPQWVTVLIVLVTRMKKSCDWNPKSDCFWLFPCFIFRAVSFPSDFNVRKSVSTVYSVSSLTVNIMTHCSGARNCWSPTGATPGVDNSVSLFNYQHQATPGRLRIQCLYSTINIKRHLGLITQCLYSTINIKRHLGCWELSASIQLSTSSDTWEVENSMPLFNYQQQATPGLLRTQCLYSTVNIKRHTWDVKLSAYIQLSTSSDTWDAENLVPIFNFNYQHQATLDRLRLEKSVPLFNNQHQATPGRLRTQCLYSTININVISRYFSTTQHIV
jgi:hypothetical protein